MNRKGAASMPVEFLVAIVIGVSLLGIAIVFLSFPQQISGEEAAKTALSSCCTNYVISGKCGSFDDEFLCRVPSSMNQDEELSIEELGNEIRVDYEVYCHCQ